MPNQQSAIRSPHFDVSTFRRFGISLGLTLVELLVVLAIIAVLISILVPSMQFALENARRLKCITQLRQLHRAVTVYASDYDGFLPVRSGQIHQIWTDQLIDGDGVLATGMASLFTMRYLTDTRINICPSKEAPVRWIKESGRPDLNNRWWDNRLWETGYSSYAYPGGSAPFKENVAPTPESCHIYWVRLLRHDPDQALFVDAVVDPEWATSFPWLQQTNHWRGDRPAGGSAVFAHGGAEWIDYSPGAWTRPWIVAESRIPDGSWAVDWYNIWHRHVAYFWAGASYHPRIGKLDP